MALSGWAFRQKLTSKPGVPAGVPENFEACLRPPDLTGNVRPDFFDAVVTDTDGDTPLDYGWEVKLASAGIGHFRIPGTFGPSQDVGYLYYGNPAASDQSDLAGTFANRSAAYLMNAASGAQADASGNASSLPQEVSPTYLASGQLGCAGASQNGVQGGWYNATGSIPGLNSTSKFTISFWMKMPALVSVPYLFENRIDSNNRLLFSIWSGYVSMSVKTSGSGEMRWSSAVAALTDNAWHLVDLVYDGTLPVSNRLELYVDNVRDTSGSMASSLPAATANMAGGYCRILAPWATNQIEVVDHLMVLAGTAAGAAWRTAEHLNGTDGLLTLGAVEQLAAPGLPAIRAIMLGRHGPSLSGVVN